MPGPWVAWQQGHVSPGVPVGVGVGGAALGRAAALNGRTAQGGVVGEGLRLHGIGGEHIRRQSSQMGGPRERVLGVWPVLLQLKETNKSGGKKGSGWEDYGGWCVCAYVSS